METRTESPNAVELTRADRATAAVDVSWVAPFAAEMLAHTRRLGRLIRGCEAAGSAGGLAAFAVLFYAVGVSPLGFKYAALVAAVGWGLSFALAAGLRWRRQRAVDRALAERGDRPAATAALAAAFPDLEAHARDILHAPFARLLTLLRAEDAERFQPSVLFRLLECKEVSVVRGALAAIGELAPAGAAKAVARFHRDLWASQQPSGQVNDEATWRAAEECLARLRERGQRLVEEPRETPCASEGATRQVEQLLAELNRAMRADWRFTRKKLAIAAGAFLLPGFVQHWLPHGTIASQSMWCVQYMGFAVLFLGSRKQTAAVAEKLAAIRDPRAAGGLALAHEAGDNATRRALVPILAELLPLVRAHHLAGQSLEQAEAIARLVRVRALSLAALDAIQELAPANAMPELHRARADWPLSDESEEANRMRQAIRGCMEAVEARRPASRAREELLRPASPDPSADSLVRPADATASPGEQLVRPTQPGGDE